ncbi:hypothetical protein Pint_08423 [Pistacia integerrima]|uniref:Uncharacterized protein n=1 Tax=Pistacia integerrima TaxID=434235 RepID=A0ACC0XTP5_9ROSI|nr:hypothetical protein Pint_08423 [Pistacia integerrima]
MQPQILSISYFVKPTAKLKLSETLKMGSEAEIPKKPRFLCLHGFRTSGKIFKIQSEKWPQQVLEKLDLVFPDAPFPSQGKSEVEGIFDPPYYEWFQFNKEFTEYTNFDECLAYIEDFMIKHGPFDGLMGFSQGAILSAGLIGLQAKGVVLTKVPKIKFLIIIGGAKFKSQSVAEIAYASPIQCPNLHFLGITFFSIFLFLILFESIYLITTLIQRFQREQDFLKPYGLQLLESCVDPVIINHPKGHTIPRLDEKGLQKMLSFIERIQKMLPDKEEK